MARHVWSILCKRVLVDKDSGENLSAIDLVDYVYVHRLAPTDDLTKLTAVKFDLQLVSTWFRSRLDQPERARARLSMNYPDGARASSSEPFILELDTAVRMRTFVKVGLLPFDGPGVYEFIVELQTPDGGGWTEVAHLPIAVGIEGAPTPVWDQTPTPATEPESA